MTRPRPGGRWLVTGAAGMLGADVVAALEGRDVTAAIRSDLDVTDADAVAAAVAGHDMVVNCAAWTAVDAAEAQEAAAFAINALAAAHLARACALAGAWLVHLSTDYVFGGDADRPYAEDASVSPRSAYGRTKAAGEWAVRAHAPARAYVVRTAWLYGEHGPNFVRSVLRLAAERETFDVVDDQRGQPTWSADVAQRLVELAEAGAPAGTYHATATGQTSWYGLARRVLDLIGEDPDRVRPVTSDHFTRPAPRPAYSVLAHEGWARAGLDPLRHWDDALIDALPALLRSSAV